MSLFRGFFFFFRYSHICVFIKTLRRNNVLLKNTSNSVLIAKELFLVMMEIFSLVWGW